MKITGFDAEDTIALMQAYRSQRLDSEVVDAIASLVKFSKEQQATLTLAAEALQAHKVVLEDHKRSIVELGQLMTSQGRIINTLRTRVSALEHRLESKESAS